MLDGLRQRSAIGSTEQSSTAEEHSESGSVARQTFFRLGRLAYGGVLAAMAIDGLRDAEERAQYAESKGVPMPELANYFAHGLLLFGGVGIALWRAPALAASAVATFFLGVTPQMHDFWTVDDPDRRQQQMTHFLKNAALLGTALALLGIARGTD